MENGREIEGIEVLEAKLALCREESNAAKEREALFQLFRDNVEDYAFVTFDLADHIAGWSRGAEHVLGYGEQEVLGKCGSIFFTPEDVSTGEARRELLSAREQGRAEGERWYQRKDGSRFWGSGVMVLLRDAAGQPQGFGKVFRDLTARKEIEDRLTASVREKDLLLREMHHRVKNNLQVITSLISLQARLNVPPGMKPHFDELEGRVRAIAALHESLYGSPDLGSILFGSYMKQLLREVVGVHGVDPHRIALHVEAADVALNIEQALPLGLVLNELLTNCIEHAFPDGRRGVIKVSLRYVITSSDQPLDDAECELSVSDDGTGAGAGRNMQDPKSLSLHIVELLMSELGGTFQFDHEPNAGAKFTVRFPLQNDIGDVNSQADGAIALG